MPCVANGKLHVVDFNIGFACVAAEIEKIKLWHGGFLVNKPRMIKAA